MANPSPKTVVVERCSTLVGVRQGRFMHARRVRPTKGDPASVAFDAAWVNDREETKGDVVGFYHTHPSGMPCPSARDDRTMHAWVGSLGKPLLCLIEADGRVHAWEYADDESAGRRMTACELLPRGIVVMFDDKAPPDREKCDDPQVPA